RKARIVLTLLKRHGMVREHRGGIWERLAEDVTRTDLSNELRDYEERREMDRRKLEAMIRYCRTARCRTRMLLEYFGETPPADYQCGHCDNESSPGETRADPDAILDAGSTGGSAEARPAAVAACPEPGEEVTH